VSTNGAQHADIYLLSSFGEGIYVSHIQEKQNEKGKEGYAHHHGFFFYCESVPVKKLSAHAAILLLLALPWQLRPWFHWHMF
jgi:hypothetical protein